MALQVDYLSDRQQLKAGSKAAKATPIDKNSHLVNKNQALDWMAAQIAVIIGFEDGRLAEDELDGKALAFARQGCEKSGVKIDFIAKVGDKLGALRPEGSKLSQIDESLEAVWLPEHLFEKFGGEVFELETDESDELKNKISVRERRTEARPTNEADNDRQIELAKALRWAANINSD